jgi:hypothetical protein
MDWGYLGSAAGLASIAIHVVEKLLVVVNHKRVRSRCCGKQLDSSLDIEETTPPAKEELPKISV